MIQSALCDNKYVFFVGTGRTGTKFLAKYFSENFNGVYSVHEPSRIIKIFSNLRLSGKINIHTLNSIIRFYKKNKVDRTLKRLKANTYIESNPWTTGAIDMLPQIYPNAYIVHIIRDPKTYIPSHLNRIHATLIGALLRNIIPYWLLKGTMTKDYSKKEWKNLSMEERMAWFWLKTNMTIENYMGDYDKYTMIKFEDIFDENFSGIKRIIQFANINISNQVSLFDNLKKTHATKKIKFTHTDQWDAKKKSRVNNICLPLLSKYDYQNI